MASSSIHSFLLSTQLFLFLLLLSYPSFCSSAKCNKDDKKALLAIKHFLGDPYIIINWDDSRGCCDWSGVRCDETTSRVTDLDISGDTHIISTIPPAVGDLPFLTSLTFHKLPYLVGTIVPDIARLTRLTFLRLDWNGLFGPIPSFLASLPNLDYINLSFNTFSGSIPPEVFSLPKLGYLRLDHNGLTGSIPDSFKGLPSDFHAILSHNSLTGPLPKSIGTVDFYKLDLSRNRLSGDASVLFHPSQTAISIDLSRNLFEFDLGKVEFPLNISEVDLNHNKIYGSIPQSIVKLPDLYRFNVTYNRLCGKIPTGGIMDRFDKWSYVHNRCLCGKPLPPCK